jgi:GAF domain-containing protein
LSAQLQPALGMSTLIPQILDVVLQLAGLERGFILHAPAGERMRVRTSRGLHAGDLTSVHFAGSAVAVNRALSTGTSVVCCDTNESPWLGLRPSVRLGGIRALMCVPLDLADGAMGVIYADSRKPGPAVSDLDLELVENVARQASTAIDAARAHEKNVQVIEPLDVGRAAEPFSEELHPAFG